MSIGTFRQSLFAAVGAAVLTVGASGSALASGCGFLPVTFVECPSNLKPSLAAFCGIWGEAKWGDNGFPHCLVVEKVAPDGSATIVYAWGAKPEWNADPGHRRLEGRIEGDVLKNSHSRQGGWAEVEYRFVAGTLRGKYRYRGRESLITLRRYGE